MRSIVSLIAAFSLSGCATLNESLELGGAMGAITGAGAVYVGHQSSEHPPSFENIALGAGIGAGLGILTSYFTHKEVVEKRQACEADQLEMHFGDLPPTPFIFPKTQIKKGSR